MEWDAVIHNEIDDELIAWRSLPGADVNNAGSVHFTPLGSGIRHRGPGGAELRAAGRQAGASGGQAAWARSRPQQVEDDLRRFKQVMEAVEPAGAARSQERRRPRRE